MQFLLITLLATAAYLENSFVALTFLLRPLIALPLLGLWLGDFQSGLMLALPAELIFIDEHPLGGHLVPEPAPALLAALGGSLLALPAGAALNSWQQLLVLLIGLPAAWGFARLNRLQLLWNQRGDAAFDEVCRQGDRRGYERLFHRVLLRSAFAGWGAALLVTTVAYYLQQIEVPQWLVAYSAALLLAILGICVATIIQVFYRRQLRLQTYLGILAGAGLVVVMLLLRGDLI
ncbi:MAG: PTS sugar transporter subunit IIC [Candidatus Delongbacteria bacterium]|nr:PTS sugar transporter subunit IIC [Candidatus Delongbacteria bacterium]